MVSVSSEIEPENLELTPHIIFAGIMVFSPGGRFIKV